MNLSREHFRAMIFYDFKCRLKPDESYDRLQMAFMDEGPSKATVYRWYNEFERGPLTLRDEERSGRPLTAVTDENVVEGKKIHKELIFETPIKAFDQDVGVGTPVRYELVSGNEKQMFSLNSLNGSLFLEKEIDLDAENGLPGEA